MAIEIGELLGKGNGLAISTIKNYYLRKTTPRKKTVEAIQLWVNKEKKENVNRSDGDNENKEIDDSDDVINNSNSKGDNEI